MNRLLLCFLLISNMSLAQEGLRYDDTKFSLGINIPFGGATYMYNVRNNGEALFR